MEYLPPEMHCAKLSPKATKSRRAFHLGDSCLPTTLLPPPQSHLHSSPLRNDWSHLVPHCLRPSPRFLSYFSWPQMTTFSCASKAAHISCPRWCYSNPPLSMGHMFLDPQWMTETTNSIPSLLLYIHKVYNLGRYKQLINNYAVVGCMNSFPLNTLLYSHS